MSDFPGVIPLNVNIPLLGLVPALVSNSLILKKRRGLKGAPCDMLQLTIDAFTAQESFQFSSASPSQAGYYY
ncbi:MAG: hypothetical protein WBA22_12710 [Candidatus Methanofastidiosia archaeon]